jgi:hypothetical protein
MKGLLTAMGVPDSIRVFFAADKLIFNYGSEWESFGENFHFVPVTSGLWTAGSQMGSELLITPSAMEAVAYLSLNVYRYPDLHKLCFIALGNLPQQSQLNYLFRHFRKMKWTLLFGCGPLGALADIRVAAARLNRQVLFNLDGKGVRVSCNGTDHLIALDKLSLSAFEKISGMRSLAATRKPKYFVNYLEQLLYDPKR